MAAEAPCYTVSPTTQELRASLEKGTDEDRLDTLRRTIVSTINGNPQNKQLKKLLHFYWEVCPKYDENGKLKQEMILVVNAIQNDLQHPNEYIRGATLRFLQKISKDAELLEPLIPTCRSCLEHRHSYVRKNAVFATFIAAESDATCNHNAFVFLAHCAMPKAVEWLSSVYDQLTNPDELLQMSIIEVIRLDCKNDTTHRPRYIRCMFELLNSSSHAVKYEAATTLTTLTQNSAAVKAAASCFVNLVIKESDNNVKLIVLDHLDTLRSKHGHILDGLTMDILQVLSSADMEVRRKAMSIVLSMTSNRNVEEVVLFLKKQLQQTQEREFEKALEYRQLLIQSIHVLAVKFSEVAASVVHALMEFLGDSNNPSALDVVSFVRDIKSGKAFRGVLRILGEYVEGLSDIQATFQDIRKVLGEIPILASEQRLLDETGGEEDKKEDKKVEGSGRPKVLADGTYATETAYTNATSTRLEAVKAASKPPLRALILGGDFFTGSHSPMPTQSMLIMTSIIRVGQSKFDSNERILNCIQTLSELQEKSIVHDIFLKNTKTAYSKMLVAQEVRSSRKSRISQLTGFSDPIYAEAYVKMHGFDIMLDVLLVNQTSNTLQNLCLDFATLGDLKLVERPAVYTIAPHGFHSIKATIKVSSTETGVIFGSILLDGPALAECCVILNDIHIDIMDYQTRFRTMWTEFEWENRVNVSTNMTDPRDYLKHVMKSTNMSCLMPEGAMSGDCDFLSANLYARSLFGEDALANLSIEKTEAGIVGHVRIRSKTQGIALSLIDRITMSQKDSKPSI
ncbi:armadillo-type protein [Suillus subalutaceus]|uniref:armadillo-type protein n=1 Tax=Suillus subalutaceus TaxID=48586 RepID=UPI001B860D06|nr:armadillo-type protein [Suillus subalutaceus]KAG1837844.1 armadillo-type protein [Suillus subalutaceus]